MGQTRVHRKRNMKRSKRHWKELQCQFFKVWQEEQVQLVACQEECLEVCRAVCRAVCQVVLQVHLQQLIQRVDQLLRRSINLIEYHTFDNNMDMNCSSIFKIIL